MPCMCRFQLSNGKNTTKNIDFVLGGDDCKKETDGISHFKVRFFMICFLSIFWGENVLL